MARRGWVMIALVLQTAFAVVAAAGDHPRGAREGEDTDSVPVAFAIMIGQVPASDQQSPGASSSVTVVVPEVPSSAPRPSTPFADEVADVKAKLMASYRLPALDVFDRGVIRMVPGKEQAVPGFPELTVMATLLQHDANGATFKVQMFDRTTLLAEPAIRVKNGGRAVAGTRLGDYYTFVLLSIVNESAAATWEASKGTGPVPIEAPHPVYPRQAQIVRLQGIIVLWTVVGVDGVPGSIMVQRSSVPALNDVAIETLKKWRFTPGKDATGKPIPWPVAVDFTFTMR